MLEAALEAGADECVSSARGHEFLTGIENFAAVRDALEAKLGAPPIGRHHLAAAEHGGGRATRPARR